MTLFQGKIGSAYAVKEICLEDTVKRRFEMLGMTPGTVVDVLNKKRGGAMIIRLRGTRFAVGKEFAEGIRVEEKQ